MQGCEAGRSPFVFTFRAYVAGAVQAGVQNVHVTSFHVVVCKRSAHDGSMTYE